LENSYQKFTRDVLVIGLANLLGALSGIVFLPLITKTLGADDYGIWVQVQAVTTLLMSFVGLGLPYAMNRFLAAKTERAEIQDEFWSVVFVVSLVTLAVSAIYIAAAGIIAEAFFEGQTDIVRISGLIILVWSVNIVFLNYLRAFRQMNKFAGFSVAATYGQLALITYLVLNGHGVFSMVTAVLAVNIFTFAGLLLLVRRQIGYKKPGFSKIKDYLNFGLPTIPGNISAIVISGSDRLVIAHFLGATSVGIYSAAYAIGTLPLLIVGILSLVLPPALSKLYDEGKMHELKTHLSYSLKYSLLLGIPFIFGSARDSLRRLYNPDNHID
jgi:O-antigen/teichoic acid export membrane protein